jgi:hypothetical protein
MNQIEQLMRQAVENPPQDGFVPTEALVAAKARVRRRRVGALGAVGVAAALSLVALPVVSGLGTADPNPAGGAPVVPLSSARAAVSGADFLELTRVPRIEYVGGLTDDGLVLEETYPDHQQRWRLVDPGTGTTEVLPAYRTTSGVLEATKQRLVFGRGFATSHGSLTVPIQIFDRASRTWSQVVLPGPPDGLGWDGDTHLFATRGDVFLAVAEGSSRITTYRLWSWSLAEPGAPEDLGSVGNVAVHDGVVVYTQHVNTPNRQVTVRDLDTGHVNEFDPQSGDCVQSALATAGDYIALGQSCGGEERVEVVTASGTPVATITGGSLGSLTDAFVTLSAYDGPDLGIYTYEFGTNRLLKVVSRSVNGSTPALGRTLTWALPDNRALVARLQ